MSDYSSSQAKVKARKKHKCSWCGEIIEQWETYLRGFCVFEGVASTFKMHQECSHAESKLLQYSDDCGWFWYSFTRGCVCDNGDKGHGTYPSCQKIKDSWAAAQAQQDPAKGTA